MRGEDLVQLVCAFCRTEIGWVEFMDAPSSNISCNRGECIEQLTDEVEGSTTQT